MLTFEDGNQIGPENTRLSLEASAHAAQNTHISLGDATLEVK